ncbi:MAG: hypothetical protein IKW35_07600 [Paludibacteraceae bacterium]|nr:hypothetical protein [Paludibacteraceae bacterium]
MGYYSDVALVLDANAVKSFDKFIEEDNDLKSLLDIATITREKEGCRMYVWVDIKWYGRNEISLLEDWLENIKESQFVFHIIGEDLEDVCTDGTFWCNPFECQIIRRIEFTE